MGKEEREKRLDIPRAIHDLYDKLAKETKFMKMKNILWQVSQLKLKYTAVNNLELPICTRSAEVLKMYAAQVNPYLPL